MDIDFEELVKEEMVDFYSVLDGLEIPREIFEECWQSFAEMELINAQADELYKQDETLTFESPAVLEMKKSWECANATYERLENACPNVSFVCLNALRLSYGELQNVFDLDSPQDKMRALIGAADCKGIAKTFMTGFKSVFQSDLDKFRRSSLSEAGTKGALVRLQPYAELKSWVLEKGEKLGASKDVARRLERQLPPHLADVSKDARRLIYETLLNRNKLS